ncbi:unnamed protein product [Phytomonas sp. Hart1]|nr:unnamed protein product [Phytomonas sp. Hart1]|eukprot:CCW66826.1 unnamed protein product [Phytomonas sp. isolate Hart1]
MTSTKLSNETLYQIFEATLSADKLVREFAEKTLNEISLQHNDLVLHLIRFCCEPVSLPEDLEVPSGSQELLSGQQRSILQKHRNMQLAAAIRVHNVIGRSDWNRNTYFTEEIKGNVRQLIIPIQCLPHVSEHVRRQLLVTTNALITYEFPEQWPQLIPHLESLLGSWIVALSSAIDSSAMNAQVLSVIVQMKAGLAILYCCCRVYEDPLKVNAAAMDAFATRLVPSLVSLAENLEGLWSQEVVRCSAVNSPRMMASTLDRGPVVPDNETYVVGSEESMLEQSPLQVELSHALRLVLKCLWSLCEQRYPKCLCDTALFHRFWNISFKGPTEVAYMHYLPWCRQQFLQRLHGGSQNGCNAGAIGISNECHCDQFEIFQKASLWRMLKWVGNLSYKLFQDFMEPKSCEKRARAVATLLCETYLSDVVQAALHLVRWHSLIPTTEECPSQPYFVWLLSSKAYIIALETLGTAVSHRRLYETILHPVSEELMTVLLFPRFAFSAEESEMWVNNPEEYVRKQMAPTGDIYNSKVVAVTTLLSLVTSSKKHVDADFLPKFANFLINQLQVYAPRGLQALGEAESGAEDWEAARRIDAALFCIYNFKKALLGMQLGHEHLENVLSTFVVPAMQGQLGFLRARAVLVLSTFSEKIQWSSPESYQTALRAALPLLRDPDTPVKIQACICFARLTCHPYARDVVLPCIAELIQHYFQIMQLMDSESVIRTLRKTISFYRDSLSQWGLELADMIVNHFSFVAQSFSSKYNLLEGDGAGNGAEGGNHAMSGYLEDEGLSETLMASDELLETLITLVKVLPRSPSVRGENIRGVSAGDACGLSPTNAEMDANLFVQMQQRVAPMLFFILSHQSGSTYGFMDSALNLLTTLLARSPCVASATWRLLPCLHHLVCHAGTTDYFAEMLFPIDNFISVSPQLFLTTPMSVLCGGETNVPRFTSSTPVASGEMEKTAHDVGGMTPAQLLQDMCQVVLQCPTSHSRETSAVLKLYDSFLQNYWLLVFSSSPSTWVFSTPFNPAVSAILGEATTSLFAESAVKPIAQQVLFTLFNRPKLNSTLRVLFCNVVFSCILADINSTLTILSNSEATYSFFEHYTFLVVQPSVSSGTASLNKKDANKWQAQNKAKNATIRPGSCADLLRSYDRALFILAFSRTMGFFSACQDLCEQEPQHVGANLAVHAVLEASLSAVVASGLLEHFAHQDLDASVREIAFHVKCLQKRIACIEKNMDKPQSHPPAEIVEAAVTAVARGVAFMKSHQSSSGREGTVGTAKDEDDGWVDEEDGFSSESSCTTASDDMEYEGSEEMMGSDDFNDDFDVNNKQDSDAMHSLCAQAQNARQKLHHGPTAGCEGNNSMLQYVCDAGDIDDEVDNFLDEDDFESAVDGVNPWGVLLDSIVANDEYFPQATRLSLWSLIGQHNASNNFTDVRAAVDLLFLLRVHSAELIQK